MLAEPVSRTMIKEKLLHRGSIGCPPSPVVGSRSDRDLLVVQLNVPAEEGEGDYFHRSFAPGKALSENSGVHVISLTNEHRRKFAIIEAADLLVITMVCDLDLMPVVERRRWAGLPTVYELNDDVFDLPVSNPRRAFYSTPFNRQLTELLMKSSDAVQFSSSALQIKYGHYHDRSAVFSNQLSYLPPERLWRNRRPVVVGWGGSMGHLEDLQTISDALSGWCRTRDDVKLHLMCAPAIAELFEAVPAHKKTLFPPGSMLDYHQFLGTLDIGIAPLNSVSYNSARSDVKFLEYASHGVVPVLQRARPYLETVREGKTGLMFDTIDELLRHLDHLVADYRDRVRLGIAARDFVLRHRTQVRGAVERLAFYQGLFPSGATRTASGHVRGRFEQWSTLEGAVRRGRHLVLLPTAFETALRDGLYAMEKGWGREAGKCFQIAQSLCPDAYLPYLYLSGCAGMGSKEAAAWAKEALARNPESRMCRMILSATAKTAVG